MVMGKTAMTKKQQSIEIVSTSDLSLSSMGAASRGALLAMLSKHYARVQITLVHNLQDLEALADRSPDLVFLGMKYILVPVVAGMPLQRKIWLAQFLDEHSIAYTGSNQKAHNLELNKQLAKVRVSTAGVATAPFFVVPLGGTIPAHTIAYPLFVKPTNRGGGLGIDAQSLVHTHDELAVKVQSLAAKHQSDALVEEFLDGREFSVAILKHAYLPTYASMPLELIAPPVTPDGARFLSEQVKCADTETYAAVTNQALKEELCTFALRAFHALGACDYGRIDIRLNGDGELRFLEANLIPSVLEGYGNFPKACLINRGMKYELVMLRIVSLALVRSKNTARPAIDLGELNDPLVTALIPS